MIVAQQAIKSHSLEEGCRLSLAKPIVLPDQSTLTQTEWVAWQLNPDRRLYFVLAKIIHHVVFYGVPDARADGAKACHSD